LSKIFVTDRKGVTHELDAQNGTKIMEIIRDAGLEIEAACGGCCACATCHVYINKNWLEKITQMEDEEESMLDMAFEVKENSRLSCQIEFNDKLDGIQLTLAPE
tara:strand:+ start:1031 stop:1342 length:312 start_codon:yes stop_codon:yes gene_type:complete